jgi:hypothetical protein
VYLEPAETAPGWHVADFDVAGRVTWSGDGSVPDPSVVIDGRPFDWATFGRMVSTFEGWEFSMRFSDGSSENEAAGAADSGDETDDVTEIIPLRLVAEPHEEAPLGRALRSTRCWPSSSPSSGSGWRHRPSSDTQGSWICSAAASTATGTNR